MRSLLTGFTILTLAGLSGCGIDTHARKPDPALSGTCPTEFISDQDTLKKLSEELASGHRQASETRRVALALHEHCLEFKTKYESGFCQFDGQNRSSSDLDEDCKKADEILSEPKLESES